MSETLQRVLRQQRPFSTACQESALALLLTADRLRRHYEKAMAPFGVTFQQYNVLRILRGAGADGLATSEIGERMIEQSPGLTRLLDKLESKGLVERKRSGRDRRQVLCWITQEGEAVLARMEKSVRGAERTAMGDLDSEELAGLRAALERVRDGIASSSTEPASPERAG